MVLQNPGEIMKKTILAILLLGALALPSFSLGIGGTFGIGGNSLDAGLSLKLDKLPPVLGIQASVGQSALRLGLTADWWLVNEKLAGILKYYLGLGGFVSLGLGNGSYLDGGVRIPVGLNFFPVKPLELFAEWAPSIGIYPRLPDWRFANFALGFRFWI